MNADVFKMTNAIVRILDYISKNPNKSGFTVFKLIDIDRIAMPGYPPMARRNFELFLKTIKKMKDEDKTSRIFGLINGGSGGFGYCLVGTVFDFFTYTIGGHEYYIPNIERASHRKSLNPDTLFLEDFDSVQERVEFLGQLPLPFLPNKKHIIPFNRITVDRNEWSIDSRRNAVAMWNELTREVINSMTKKDPDDSQFFNRVARSDYAILTTIIRKVLSS